MSGKITYSNNIYLLRTTRELNSMKIYFQAKDTQKNTENFLKNIKNCADGLQKNASNI